jgi:hypothetical protein
MGNSLKEVLGWSGSQCLAFRKELKGHGYLQKSLKFWAYAALVKRSRPKSAAPVHRSDFDVKKAGDYYKVFSDGAKNRTVMMWMEHSLDATI